MLNSCRNLRDTNLRDKKVRNRVNQRIKDLKKRYWEKFISDMEHNLFIFIEI
jgi:ribosomal protein S17E